MQKRLIDLRKQPLKTLKNMDNKLETMVQNLIDKAADATLSEGKYLKNMKEIANRKVKEIRYNTLRVLVYFGRTHLIVFHIFTKSTPKTPKEIVEKVQNFVASLSPLEA